MPATTRGATTSWSPSPELHLPIDQPVKVLLRSKDVLHNFTVAEFRVKMDLVPGMVTYMWLTPTRTGGVRRALRGAVRRRAFRDARPRGGRLRRGLPARGWRSSRRSRQLAARAGAGCGRGPGDVCDLHRVSRGERRGQRDAERAEARRTAPWYVAQQLQQLQARHPRRRARRDDRGADGAVRLDARRRGGRERGGPHRDAARRPAARHAAGRCRARRRVCT